MLCGALPVGYLKAVRANDWATFAKVPAVDFDVFKYINSFKILQNSLNERNSNEKIGIQRFFDGKVVLQAAYEATLTVASCLAAKKGTRVKAERPERLERL